MNNQEPKLNKSRRRLPHWELSGATYFVTFRLVNQSRGTTGSIWQDESQDRIIRDEDEAFEKAQYIFDNPRRAGLVDRPEEYPFYFTGS